MKLTAKLDIQPLKSYYQELAAELRRDLPSVLRGEAAATVNKVLEMSKSRASVSKVKDKGWRRVYGRVDNGGKIVLTTNSGRRGGQRDFVWGKADGQKAFPIGLLSNKRLTGPMQKKMGGTLVGVWAGEANDAKHEMDAMVNARGLTQKSWYAIIEKLAAGTYNVADFIRRARPVKGNSRTVGFAATTGENTSSPVVTIANTSGLAVITGGERKLQSAISIRRAFFMRNLRTGMFATFEKASRAYPFIR